MRLKKLITVLAVTALSLLPAMTVGATGGTSNGIVFDGDTEQFVTDLQGTGFTGMLPGETQEVSFVVTNDDPSELRFYMSAALLKNIAASGEGNAVYEFNMYRNNETAAFFSAVIGREVDISAGADLMNSDNKILVDALNQGESASVRIELHLDPATANDMQDQAGNIQLQFSVETIDPAPTVTETITQTVTGGDSVKTGDDSQTQIFLYMGLAVAAAVAIGTLLVALKKKNRKNNASSFIVGLLVVSCAMLIPSNVVDAAAATPSYEVSFKAGVNGTIDGRGSIDVIVEYNNPINLDAYAAMVDPEDGYAFAGWSTGESKDVTVVENMKLIAQYNRIITEASYVVNYLDDFGNSIFTQKVVTTELGLQVFENAPAIEGFTIEDATQSAIVNDTNGTEINFIYTTIPDVITEVVTETETTPDATPAATPAADDTTTIDDATPPLADTPDDATEDPTTDIEDTEVPLADGTDPEETDIEDSELPLSSGAEATSNTLPLVIGIVAAALLAGAGAVVVIKKKKTK